MNRSTSAMHMVESGLNGILRLDPEFLDALKPLQSRILAVEFTGFQKSLYVQLGVEGVTLLEEEDFAILRPGRTVDISFAGSPPAILRMISAMRRGAGPVVEDVRIAGDLLLLESLKLAFQRLDIDLEELLSQYLGDVAAHEIGRLARAFRVWARRTRETLLMDAGEFLVEELRVSPSALELNDFADEVDRLRDDVERIEKRVVRIKNVAGEPRG